MRIRLSRSTVLAALLLLSSSAGAGTRYVNGVLATGNNDGTSWADAYRGVDAVAVALTASIAGDEIWVAAGTYKPTTTATRTISHVLKTGVALYGGFIGTETLLSQRDYVANVTILSGDIGTAGVNTDNSLHVVRAGGVDATAILDGFTVTEGNASGTTFQSDSRGGGIYLSGSLGSPGATICNSRFMSNRSTFRGGAASVRGSSPTFVNVLFDNNVSDDLGGAASIEISHASLDRCTFIGNTARRGGAIHQYTTGDTSSTRILNCLFRDNVATNFGGGAIWTSSSFLLLRNCTIVENSSTVVGTAGLHVDNSQAVSATNCILWNNSGPGGAQGAADQVSGTMNITYSIVEGGIAGTGNLNVDPLFVNAPAHDYSLTIASPAIDAGRNDLEFAGFTLDLAGRPRFADEPTVADTGAGVAPIVDIGAFEFPVPMVTAFCTGDSTATSCPCSNDAPLAGGTGCLNSLGTGGLLAWAGSARISTDTLVVLGSGMPNSPCLYFQGTTQINGGAGSLFGDGILCVGGSVIRLGTKTNSAGTSQYPVFGDLSISAMGMVTTVGSTRTYQCWYRNAASFCAAATFNLTNGLSVTWEL